MKALLDKYADEGLSSLESGKVLKLKPFTEMGTPMEIVNEVFGGKMAYEAAIQELEKELFKREQSV